MEDTLTHKANNNKKIRLVLIDEPVLAPDWSLSTCIDIRAMPAWSPDRIIHA